VCPGFVETDMWTAVAQGQSALLNQSPEEFTRRQASRIPLGRMERLARSKPPLFVWLAWSPRDCPRIAFAGPPVRVSPTNAVAEANIDRQNAERIPARNQWRPVHTTERPVGERDPSRRTAWLCFGVQI